MKALSKVGFLSKNSDNIEYLNYYDTFDYCLKKIHEEEKIEEFNNSGLSPFDFLLGPMHYIFVNPLFQNDKYLVCQNNMYYTVNKEKVLDTCDMNEDDTLYANIMTTFYDEMDSNIFMLQAKDDMLDGDFFLEESCDCFILENGKIIKKEEVYRHSTLANTICNSELIRSQEFCQAYIDEMTSSNHYSELFLVGKCNFVEIDYSSDSCVVLYNKERITDIQKEAIKSVIGDNVTIISNETQGNVSSIITQGNQKTETDNIKR